MKKNSGFTLVELVITMAIAAILVGVAVPSFQTTLQNNLLATQANDFITALNLARSEAIKRGVNVISCKSANGADCTLAGNWAQGWIVFADQDGDGAIDPGELLRVQGVLGGGNSLIGNGIVFVNSITYQPDGTGTPGTMSVCDARGNASARAITINFPGRVIVRTRAAAVADGVVAPACP